jgi:hypothetical protein
VSAGLPCARAIVADGREGAKALVTLTIALTTKDPGAPEPRVLRQALFAGAFNPATRDIDAPPEIAAID